MGMEQPGIGKFKNDISQRIGLGCLGIREIWILEFEIKPLPVESGHE